MNHLEQDELVLQFYREGRRAAAQHLEECADCRSRLANLATLLSAIRAPETPARSADYGSQVWHNLRAHLPEKSAPRSLWFPLRRWAAVGAVAALVVAAFLAGRYGSRPAMPPAATAANQAPERVLLVALGDHLDRSEMLLVELSHADNPGDLDVIADRKRADDLIASNRLYRQTAQRVGDNATVAVLDELERVLLEVAHQPNLISADDLRLIREQIESKGLLFKVRVVQLNVNDEIRDTHAVNPPQPRPTI